MFPTFTSKKMDLSECSGRLAGLRRIILSSLGIMVGICGGEIHGIAADNTEVAMWQRSAGNITNVAQFRSMPREVFLGHCAFQLDGVVTLVDPDRNLLVLQDETGAVALFSKTGGRELGIQPGERVSLAASRCFPHVVVLPDFPYRPSGVETRPAFEVTGDQGDYYLARLRGLVQPPVTGEYTFWIASDNSSELWLSSSDDPTKVRRIAFLSRYSWVAPREWTRSPSQRSESVQLQAGQTYYLEAFHEQTTRNNHVAVAWQGPTVKQGVIDGRYLAPWRETHGAANLAATNGVVREYWTNFPAGILTPLTGPKPYESALSVDDLRVIARSEAAADWPKPRPVVLGRELRATENYSWVEARGNVTFAGRDHRGAFLELAVGETPIQVRILQNDLESLKRFRGATVQLQGVCEGVSDPKNGLVAGLIWVARAEHLSVVETGKTNPAAQSPTPAVRSATTDSNPAMMGFFGMQGVVTFNDRVWGQDLMFVQEDAAAIFVSAKDRHFNRFEVGRWVDVGGALNSGENIPQLNSLVITELGWRLLPVPMTQPVTFPVPGNRDGRWTEFEGVGRTVNTNGTITLMGSGGPLAVWIGKTPVETLDQYVDAKLRVRGVLSLTIQHAPLLLVASPGFVSVEREAPDPFAVPTRLASDLFADELKAELTHRVKLVGNVTFAGKDSFFLQDASGGVRVQYVAERELPVGTTVEVAGFPGVNGAIRTLTEAWVRPVGDPRPVPPQKLDAGAGISFHHAGALVQIQANLIAQRLKEGRQVLELQEKQRVFEAELPLGQTELPRFQPGSRLQLSGICDFATVAPAGSGNLAAESPSTGALKLWLRSPADVVQLSGPPWWTWKHTAALVGTLLTVLVVSSLRIHLLRRRLERQLVFSRQILESQESERHRIAANLHDSLGQNLLVIKNQARLAMQPVTDESILRQRLDEISGCASQAIEEVREITHALRPYQLDRLGLTQTIRATVSRAAENSAILFASHADDIDGVFDKESEIHVYRIVQEAVNNILKHSAATEATVVVKKLAAEISLSIRDNGRGFDATAAQNSNSHDVGHGLSGIKERVRILGATLAIDSRSGQGTNLSIEIPVLASKHEAT